MMLHFSDEKLQIQELFKALIHRGKRDVRSFIHPNIDMLIHIFAFLQEIRAIFRLCRTEFECDRYAAVRQHLYSFSSGNLKHRQFIALCEVRL